VGFCEHWDELFRFCNNRKILELLNNYQELREDHAYGKEKEVEIFRADNFIIVLNIL